MANKIEVLEAAKSAFRRYGFEKTTLDDVAKECGIQKTAIYYYFKNKDELIENVMRYIIDEVMAECNNVIDSKKTMETNLYLFIKIQLETFNEHKKFMKVVRNVDIPFKYIELAGNTKNILVDFLTESYRTIMDKAIQDDRINVTYVDTAINILIFSVFNCISQMIFESHEIDIDELIYNTIHVVLNGIEQ